MHTGVGVLSCACTCADAAISARPLPVAVCLHPSRGAKWHSDLGMAFQHAAEIGSLADTLSVSLVKFRTSVSPIYLKRKEICKTPNNNKQTNNPTNKQNNKKISTSKSKHASTIGLSQWLQLMLCWTSFEREGPGLRFLSLVSHSSCNNLQHTQYLCCLYLNIIKEFYSVKYLLSYWRICMCLCISKTTEGYVYICIFIKSKTDEFSSLCLRSTVANIFSVVCRELHVALLKRKGHVLSLNFEILRGML